MPRYKITDPVTGKMVTISGDKPPTQEDADRVFQDAGLRSNVQKQQKPNILQSFATGVKNQFMQGAGKFAELTGKAVGYLSPEVRRLEQETEQNRLKQAEIASRVMARKMAEGDTEAVRQIAKLQQQTSGQASQQYQQRATEADQAMRDIPGAAVKTGLTVLGAPAVGAGQLVAGAGLSGGMEAGRQVLSGEQIDVNKIAESAGRGSMMATETAGLTRFTNPLTNVALSKTTGIVNPIAQRAARASVGGLANVGEDVVLDSSSGNETNPLLSFGIGAVTGGVGSAPKATSFKGALQEGMDTSSNLLGAFGKQDVGQLGYKAPGMALNATGKALTTTGEVLSKAPGAIARAPIGGLKMGIRGIDKVASGIAGAGRGTSEFIGRTLANPAKAGEQASSVIAPGSTVEEAERLAPIVIGITKGRDTRQMAKETQKLLKNASNYMDDLVAQRSAIEGPIPADDIIDEIRTQLKTDDRFAGQDQLIEDYLQRLKSKITFGQQDFAGTVGDATSREAIGKQRRAINANPYYKKYDLGTFDRNKPGDLLELADAKVKNLFKEELIKDDPEIAKALEIQEALKTSSRALNESGLAQTGGVMAGVDMVGDLAGRSKLGIARSLLKPFTDTANIAAVRSSIDPETQAFYDTIRGYENRKVPETDFKSVDFATQMGITENKNRYIPGNLKGTALEGSKLKKKDNSLISPFNQQGNTGGINTEPRSVATNIQAKYAAPAENRWNSSRGKMSDNILARKLETMGEAQRNRFLQDNPEANDLANLTRKQQEKLLQRSKSIRYGQSGGNAAYGGLAGLEPEYDEEGNVIGVKYNPEKGFIGVAGMIGGQKAKGYLDDNNLKPLLEEAKKYKSAEEFGTNIVNVSNNVKANELIKPSIFTIYDDGNAVGRLHLSEDNIGGKKLAHIDGIEIDKKFRGKGLGKKLLNDAMNALRLSSYDGIVARYETIKNKKEIPYIFNKLGFSDIGDGTATGKIFTDKSQLTDIYNQATKQDLIKPFSESKKIDPLLEEAKKYKSAEETILEMQLKADNLRETFQKTRDGSVLREWRKLQNEVNDYQQRLIEDRENLRLIEQRKNDFELKKSDTSIDNLDSKDSDFLINEAKKHNTLDEFLQKMRGSATQYGEYQPQLRKYVKPESKLLYEITDLKPEDTITVYRGIDNPRASKINDGDFVTTDYADAKQYIGPNGRVVSKKVKAKNLINEYPDEIVGNNIFYELIYKTKPFKKITNTKLIDIYNQANQAE